MSPTDLPSAIDYANGLLEHLGAPRLLAPQPQPHPALRWAHSGAMSLTGYPGEAAQVSPVPMASYADGIVAALQSLRRASALEGLDGGALLGERAALNGYTRAGSTSAGGSCRLMQAQDGWLAVNLPRPGDWELIPAWLEAGSMNSWQDVAAALRGQEVRPCIERGRLAGLAVAGMQPAQSAAESWCRELWRGRDAAPPAPGEVPLVVDLSSLWAGPLCTQLLQLMGARVIKVESSARPDGLRRAGDGFFDLLNAGRASLALDLQTQVGRADLRRLLTRADIVVEASRPRALRHLGVHAEEILAEVPRLTWVSITGHGREEPAANWIALGDDGAVAGGLSQVLWEATGRAMFCADAIADPLTGLHAALAAWTGFSFGGGRLYSLALAAVTAHGIRCAGLSGSEACKERALSWGRLPAAADVAAPRARAPVGSARQLGADTAEVLAAIG